MKALSVRGQQAVVLSAALLLIAVLVTFVMSGTLPMSSVGMIAVLVMGASVVVLQAAARGPAASVAQILYETENPVARGRRRGGDAGRGL